MKERISIIVPCRNEQDALPLFCDALCDVLDSMDCSREIILVDDGSTDGTLDIMKRLSQENSSIHYISFSRNFGKEAAMYAGLRHVSGDYVAIMDADMQDPPSLLPEMLRIIRSGEYDSVAARRQDRKGEKPLRSWLSNIFYRIINRVSDVEIVEGARDFRLMKRAMADAAAAMGERGRFSKGLFSWIGFRTCWLSFPNSPRAAGETKWEFRHLVRYALGGIADFSTAPLTLVSWLGGIMTAASFAALLFVVVRRLLFGDPVSGWASTMCVIVFLGGIQLVCLGVIGQYLARVYTETKRRPHYIVAETDLPGADQ